MRAFIQRGVRGPRIGHCLAWLMLAAVALDQLAFAESDPLLGNLLLQPAVQQRQPAGSMILAAKAAGKRIVAVGEQGTVLLSDDNGQTFRQAIGVPVRTQLNGLQFIDEQTGWAVGHGGVVLRTDDGGEHWALQRSDFDVDRPLFSVYFRDRNEGWAVGLWSLMLHTTDGGKRWVSVSLPPLPDGRRPDLNLFSLFGDHSGNLFVAGERGMVLRSTDGGNAWSYVATGYQGSLWAGAAADDGTLLVGGLRGALFRSTDAGGHWTAVALGQSSSIVSIFARGERVYAVGLDGLQLTSADHGRSFKLQRQADRLAMTAAVPTASGALVAFSKSGVVSAPAR
ncbi:YCF48-related protein [Pseudomonas sp. R5(2019)]|uniref:WD40/YVTN/BNR-like repeat-containing protein n=1 Tax=Pseudomonas sp. R5(2019) TaxID=2697566 RepID=UPI0014128F1A|nr:YCF48-related protein [Pseudomonas sp. R5(2019)]NBA98148.1 glycosyl hydrolase [Pseudomonas sp. R5(2019)]